MNKLTSSLAVVFAWIFLVLLTYEINIRPIKIVKIQPRKGWLEMQDEWRDSALQKAYMKGIEAQSMDLPTEIKKDKYYIVSIVASESGTVSKIYPGYQE